MRREATGSGALWIARNREDEYVGTLVNAYLSAGGEAVGIKAGRSYVDVGTLHGYRAAMRLLAEDGAEPAAMDHATKGREATAPAPEIGGGAPAAV